MKFTLNEYQAETVGHLLAAMERAKKMYHDPVDPKETSQALSAPTGAGKTVMVAAVIEALLFGSDRFDFAADPSAVVIWFSDSPQLNDQSRNRLMQASEKLTPNVLVQVQPPFAMAELESRKVYFVNSQKLGKNSLLTRGYVESKTDSQLEDFSSVAPPDQLAWNIWQTIANTIENEEKTVYFVLDEAHRGFDKKSYTERGTIVRRLVTGDQTGIAMPIVLGISATLERFKNAMAEADNRGERVALPDVVVEPSRVQASGLVKDTIVLDIPDEPGDFSTTLVTEAAKKLQQSAVRWKKYGTQEPTAAKVVPLLVLQIPNTPNTDDVGKALDAIQGVISDLSNLSVRHVLTEGGSVTFGRWAVDHIDASRVQETTEVRVLIAKEAISTGWDCPRAEVLVSFRPAKDQTHITQLLGRMVRNPLAYRIPGNDRLNAVDCILPFFDRTTAGYVVKYMTGQIDELPSAGGGRLLLDGRELLPNADIDDDVWLAFDELPTQTAPQKGVKPIKRLVALAQALSTDGLNDSALSEVSEKSQDLLDGLAIIHKVELATAVDEIHKVHVQTLTGVTGEDGITYGTRVIKADDRAIRTGFEDAKRAFGADVAMSYVNHLCALTDDDEALREAYVQTAALATVKVIREKIDKESDATAEQWFDQHRVSILSLSDERQQEYEEIRSLATEPQRSVLRRPKNRLEAFSVATETGKEPAALVKLHLMSDETGDYPVGGLNQWEREIVEIELNRKDTSGWYRNPAHNGVDSLAVAYRDEQANWRTMHPDFLFFNRIDGQIKASIVDPHGHHLADSLVKLQGLARFAERYGDAFHRIEATAKIGTNWKVLDLKKLAVQDLVKTYQGDVINLYKDELAATYA